MATQTNQFGARNDFSSVIKLTRITGLSSVLAYVEVEAHDIQNCSLFGKTFFDVRENESLWFFWVCLFFACSMPTVCHKVHCNEKETWAIQTSPLTSLFTINTLGNCTWKKGGWWFFLLFRFFWGKNVLQVDGEEKMLHSHSEMKVWVHWRDGMLNSGFRRKA